MAKSRCRRDSRKCISGCVGKKLYQKIKKCTKGSKKCVDQVCHKKTAKRGRSAPVVSNYSLRSRVTKK
jgi:hypothetical protein